MLERERERERENEHHKVKISRDPPAQENFKDTIKRENWSKNHQ